MTQLTFIFVVHIFIAICRFDSMPALRQAQGLRLPTPPRGGAVGTVFGAEPSNCTDETLTRVKARFTGAPRF